MVGLVPYMASGRFGIPGVGINDDLSLHLTWILQIDSSGRDIATAYPTGPHVLAATALRIFGTDAVELAYVGMTVTLQVASSLAAYVLLRRARTWIAMVAAPVVASAYLASAYMAQGAFKEPATAGALLLFVALLDRGDEGGVSRRWMATSLVLAAASGYVSLGAAALAWPLAIGMLWLTVSVVRRHGRQLVPTVRRRWRGILVTLAMTAAVGFIGVKALSHQLTTLATLPEGGNIPSYVSGYSLFGIWFVPDFRYMPADLFRAGILVGIAVLFVIASAVLLLRNGRWLLPIACGVSVSIYVLAREMERGGPYWVTKLMVVPAPLFVALVLVALFERSDHGTRTGEVLRVLTGATFLLVAAWSSSFPLLSASIQPLDKARELAAVRKVVGSAPVAYIGQDYFIQVKMRDTPTSRFFPYSIVLPKPISPMPGRDPAMGSLVDIATVDPASVDMFKYVLTTSSAYRSALPPNLTSVVKTPNYELFKRAGPTPRLHELGPASDIGAVLSCDHLRDGLSAENRPKPIRLTARNWTADPAPTVYEPNVIIGPGHRITQRVRLTAGEWDLSMQYLGAVPLKVEVGAKRFTLLAEPDIIGEWWPTGRFELDSDRTVTVAITPGKPPLSRGGGTTILGDVELTPIGGGHKLVPTSDACGQYVDWLAATAELDESAEGSK
jgi:hypothetical protein